MHVDRRRAGMKKAGTVLSVPALRLNNDLNLDRTSSAWVWVWLNEVVRRPTYARVGVHAVR
jgi:hypothetical protein